MGIATNTAPSNTPAASTPAASPTAGKQYLRKVSFIVEPNDGLPGIDLSQMHLRFAVKRGDIQTPNSVDVRVYNLDDTTAKRIQAAEYANVILNAGYQTANYGLIFIGQLSQSRRGRETSVDTVVDITASDGGYAYAWCVMNSSLAAGATPSQAWAAFTNAMNSTSGGSVKQGDTANVVGPKMPRGQVFFGMGRDIARDMAKTWASTWGIQDGKITLTGLTQAAKTPPIPLSPLTGLIGVPEQLVNGFHFRTLLNANIKINSIVSVDANLINKTRYPLDIGSAAAISKIPMTDANGNYRVIYAEHTGDTRGQEWYTDLICLPVSSTIIPDSIVNKGSGLPAFGNVPAFGNNYGAKQPAS